MLAATDLSAQSSDIAPVVDTLNRLERQIRALERTVYRGDDPPAQAPSDTESTLTPRSTSQMQVRLDQFEEEVRSLTGQVERMGFQIRQLTDRLEKLVADVDFRLRTLEQGGVPAESDVPLAEASPPPPGAGQPGPPSTGGTIGQLTEDQLRNQGIEPAADELALLQPQSPQATAVPASVQLPDGSVDEQYNYARSFLLRRDFDNAEVALQEFVERNPESPLAGNAQYWLGETHYVRDDFQRAARTFAEGYQTYPDSSKAPDNLLKLGLSLANLERTEDACLTLSKLQSEYPDAPSNILQRAQREAGRLSCS